MGSSAVKRKTRKLPGTSAANRRLSRKPAD
jgi:hypothetical protein